MRSKTTSEVSNVPSLNGKPGKVTVLAFLEPTCPKCQKQDRLLEIVSRQHTVRLYNYWQAGVERALARVERHPTFIVVIDDVEVYRTNDVEDLM
jgi:thiol-disulfide isomerase/thioredoxin